MIGGTAASDFDADIVELEVEENADLPSAFSITLPVNTTFSGDYDTISDPRLAPLSNIAVTAQAADGQTQCLIDGYVLAQQIHLDTGTSKSTVKVWGQDASWLMNTTEKTREWVDVTDGAAANTIFGEYGFSPDPSNLDDDLPAHTSDGASLMQRASDAQFLRGLARRGGKLFRVFCTDTPGQRTGSFATPNLSADPAVTLTLNDASAATVTALDISWDVMRPSAVTARQALFTDKDSDGAGGTVSDDGLPTMDQTDLATFATTTVTALLTTTAADAGTLTQRADSVPARSPAGSCVARAPPMPTGWVPSCVSARLPSWMRPAGCIPATTWCGACATTSPRRSTRWRSCWCAMPSVPPRRRPRPGASVYETRDGALFRALPPRLGTLATAVIARRGAPKMPADEPRNAHQAGDCFGRSAPRNDMRVPRFQSAWKCSGVMAGASPMNDALLHDLLDHVRHRFYGKYRGIVTDVDASTMRIKASVPAVLPSTPTGWCAPCVPLRRAAGRLPHAARDRQRRVDRVRRRRRRAFRSGPAAIGAPATSRPRPRPT